MGCKVEGQGNTELSVQTDDDVHFGILGGLISTFQISLNFVPFINFGVLMRTFKISS